jgi:hypothetical protein
MPIHCQEDCIPIHMCPSPPSRGNTLKNCRDHSTAPAGTPVRDLLLPTVTLAPGSIVYFQPRRLKHNADPHSFKVAYEVVEGNPVHALATYLHICQGHGQPIVDILARLTTPDRRTFKEQPMTSSQLTAGLRRFFSAAGIEYHVTTHGARRGAIQATAREGASLNDHEVAELAQIKTPRVALCYQDERRHLPCLLEISHDWAKPLQVALDCPRGCAQGLGSSTVDWGLWVKVYFLGIGVLSARCLDRYANYCAPTGHGKDCAI